MSTQRFEALAQTLAERDRSLASAILAVEPALEVLRERAARAVAVFVNVALEHRVPHLTHLSVGPVEPDEKHIDCLQFKVRRGRWEIVCVGKPRGVVTLVGPYRSGKQEGPCSEHPLHGNEVEAALDDRLVELIQSASER